MISVYDKDDTRHRIVDDSNIQFITINTTANKIRIQLNISKNGGDNTPDIATVFVFGVNKTNTFCCILNFERGGNVTINNIVGNTTIASTGQEEATVWARLNSTLNSTIFVLSTCPINRVRAEN